MEYILFEKPIAELEMKIEELRKISATKAVNLSGEIHELELKAKKLRKKMFQNLSAYEMTKLSRHPRRPNTLELVSYICEHFVELHGDRSYYDDQSIVGGLGRIDDISVVLIGHQKGRTTKENIKRNFGMAKPEGYRKALRLMKMAEKFQLPIITFVDTPGAYPGVGAEQRGQSEAIGKSIMEMSSLKVPIISFVVGEGGSGGALSIAVANRNHMLEYSVYSVISPEGCASILMKDASKAANMAEALKITAESALKLGVIDSIIKEPEGGAHRGASIISKRIKDRILLDLKELKLLSPEELMTQRIQKFASMGPYKEL